MKNKNIGLVTLLLTLNCLAGCTTENPNVEDSCKVNGHNYIVQKDDTKHWSVCSKCGEKLEGSEKEHTYEINNNKKSNNKEATCTEPGCVWKICSCGQELKETSAALNHNFEILDDRSNVVTTSATCTEAGEATVKCSRCDAIGKVADAVLDHAWVHDPTRMDIPASCTGEAVLYQKCSRCDKTRIIDGDAPLGHSLRKIKTNQEEGFASLDIYACDNCNHSDISWSAKEVTENCKTNKRIINQGTANEIVEPNYIEDGDGVKFWGRPKGNACSLSAISGNNFNPIFDESVAGSFLEYKINLENFFYGSLSADFLPYEYLGNMDLFKNDANDWTPGLISDGKGGYKKADFRYEIVIDENTDDETVLEFDSKVTTKITNSERNWYDFTTGTFGLSKGTHIFKITMTGGCIATFYNFKLIDSDIMNPHGPHNYIKDDTRSFSPTCTEDGHYYGVCSCGMVRDDDIPALGHYYISDPKPTDYAPTCTTTGQRHAKCTREGCNFEGDLEIPATGHIYNDSKISGGEGMADFTYSVCTMNDSNEYYWWSAKEVTENCKTNKRIINQGTANEIVEPNYIEDGDGVKFWGRPKGNAVALNSNGQASSNNHTPIYDASVAGSFVEYKINVVEKLENVKFAAYMDPSDDIRTGEDLWKSLNGDWTPGQSAESTNMPFRYEVIIDGNPVALDESINSPVPDKVGGKQAEWGIYGASYPSDWYNFPMAAMDVEPGEHTIKIVCCGGYIGTFYDFGFVAERN